MGDWLIILLLVPGIVAPVVLLFGFAGCGFEISGSPYLAIDSAAGKTTNTITLTWSYDSSSKTRYVTFNFVRLKLPSRSEMRTFTIPADAPASGNGRQVQSMDDPDVLEPGTRYEYTLEGIRSDGEGSGDASPVQGTTLSPPASPVLVSQTINSGNAADASATLNMPASVVAGNRLIAVVYSRNDPTCTWPAGWTERFDTNGLSVAERTADGMEGASIIVTQNSSNRYCCACIQLSGATADVEVGLTATSTSTNPDPGAITPSWAGATTYIAVAGIRGDSDFSAPPAGYSSYQTARANNGPALATAIKDSIAGGAEDPGPFTNASGSPWTATTIAVKGS